MQVATHERGRLHVFAVNQPKAAMADRFAPPETGADRLQPDPSLLADLTGASGLDPKGAELLPLDDLEGLGLSGYLTEGLDIPAEAVTADKRRLDALEGYALLLSSRAFQGQSFALGETASLTHIASFDQPGTDWSSIGQIPSEAAKPHSGPMASNPTDQNRSRRIGGTLIALAVICIAILIWILAT